MKFMRWCAKYPWLLRVVLTFLFLGVALRQLGILWREVWQGQYDNGISVVTGGKDAEQK